jgi:hypothetical protein
MRLIVGLVITVQFLLVAGSEAQMSGPPGEVEITKQAVRIVEVPGKGEYQATAELALKNTGNKDVHVNFVGFSVRDLRFRCNVCEKSEEWQDHPPYLFKESYIMRVGEVKEFEIVYATLKADIPGGKHPAPPKCVIQWCVGQIDGNARYVRPGRDIVLP